MNKKEISMQIYTARNFKPYENIFKFLSEQGLRNVELFEVEAFNETKILLEKYNLNYNLEWKLSGAPFLTDSGSLIDATTAAIKEIVGIDTVCSTGGGTSDGRFIAPTGAQTIELGVVNETIHKINECVKVEDLDTISDIYERVLDKLLSN